MLVVFNSIWFPFQQISEPRYARSNLTRKLCAEFDRICARSNVTVGSLARAPWLAVKILDIAKDHYYVADGD